LMRFGGHPLMVSESDLKSGKFGLLAHNASIYESK
jgi:hypothetical protein